MKPTLPTLLAILLLLVAPAALAACGADEDAAPEVPTATEEIEGATDEDVDELRAEADRVETTLREQVEGLRDVRTLEDVEDRVADARRELDTSRERLSELDLSGEQEEARGELEAALRDLDAELERLEATVDDRDVVRALQRASELSLADVERAVERVRDST